MTSFNLKLVSDIKIWIQLYYANILFYDISCFLIIVISVENCYLLCLLKMNKLKSILIAIMCIR